MTDDATRWVHLVRHGRPIVDPTTPAAQWHLDPSGWDAIGALRRSGRLPTDARWFCSPEPKALETIRFLTDAPFTVVDEFAEQLRLTPGLVPDMDEVRRRAFARPRVSAHPGWEPLRATAERVGRKTRAVLADHPGEDLVVVGHGTALALLASTLTGAPPDPTMPEALGFPDVVSIEMHAQPPVPPPSFRTSLWATALVAVAELVGWQITGRLGVVAAVVAVVGAALAMPRRTRQLGWTCLAGAAIGLAVAVTLVVAAAPRTGA